MSTAAGRVRLEASLESIDVGEADLRAARLLLEAELESVKATASVVQSEVESLRLDYSAAVKERNEGKERLRELTSQLEVAEKEMGVWKQRAHKMQANEAKIDKMEKIIAAAAHYSERIRENDAEMARMEEAIVAMQAQVGLREEKEKELQALKTRTKQLEKECREAAKWKAQVKALEKEAHEAGRWKVLVKQGKVREKALETQLKELHHWRQRARAFEKEVKLLRGWKRAVCEQAVREGKEAMIPEFPLEGGLDSSGSSGDLLSSGASGLGDSGSGCLTSGSVDSGSAASASTGGRFFDLIRTGPHPTQSSAAASAQQGGSADFFDYDASMAGAAFDSEADFLSSLQQQRAAAAAEFDSAAGDDADMDMDLQSLMAAYSTQDLLQSHHLPYFPADRDDDSSLDDSAFALPSSHFESYDEDEGELMKAGASDKRIKEMVARGAYSASSTPDASTNSPLGAFAPPRVRPVPTFYPSSASSAFNPSIVYDEVTSAQPPPRLHPPAAFHPSTATPQPPHGFFASWPAPSSASPLLIIDDRGEGKGGSAASTQSGGSMASTGMGPAGHVFSMSSPSPFAVVDGEERTEGPSPVPRLKGGVWGVGSGEATAAPPGLGTSTVGRFSAPLVIIDDGQVTAREGL